MTRDSNRPSLKIVIVGHVDHGKSTLVGRLFHDTGSLPEGKIETIKAVCERRGMPFEWAFLMDALQAERDQGITIDTAQIRFRTKARDYVIIDAPGHREFLKNMVTGAASSEAALLLIDADEGVREQSRRHGYLLHLLGVDQVAVLVNKMDLVGLQRRSLRRRGRGVSRLSRAPRRRADVLHPGLGARGRQHRAAQQAHALVPGADHARGARPVQRRRRTGRPAAALPIQDVYKFDERRILAGRIESGRLEVGDELLFSPSNKTAKVRSIEAWHVPMPPLEASAGQSIGITLDEQIFVERGEVASHKDDAPIESNVFRGAPVLARPQAARAGQPLHPEAERQRDRGHGPGDRPGDRHGRPVVGRGRPGRAQRGRRGRAAHARPARRSTSTA